MATEPQEPSALPETREDRSSVTRRRFIGKSGGVVLAVGGVGSFLAACGGDDDGASTSESSGPIGSKRRSGDVTVVTWGGPDRDKAIGEAFKAATGISVQFIPGEGDADFFNKVNASPGQYDVCIANIGIVPRFQKAGLIETLDYKDFPVHKELYPVFLTDERFNYVLGNGKVLCLPHQWGAYGMTFLTNQDDFQVSEPYSWQALWDAPEGTVGVDGYHVTNLAIAGRMSGLEWDQVFAMKGAQLEKAVDLLKELKPFDYNAGEDQRIQKFVGGSNYIALQYGLGFGGRINEKAGEDIAMSVEPKEGTVGALDGVMLLKDAPNRENALEYLNFEAGAKAQEILWDLWKSPNANRVAVEAIIARGGADATLMKSQKGTDPEVAAAMTQMRDPDAAEEWTAGWDDVIG
jgi:spermidine/putrescine-binding protein